MISRQLLAVDEALLRLAKSIAGFTTLNDLVRHLPASLSDAVPFDHLGLVLHDADRDLLRIALVHPEVPLPVRQVPVDYGPAGVVLRSQQTRVVRLETREAVTGMAPGRAQRSRTC